MEIADDPLSEKTHSGVANVEKTHSGVANVEKTHSGVANVAPLFKTIRTVL